MVDGRRVRYWLSLILPLVLATVLLVACDAGEQEGGGGGLGDETSIPGDDLGTGDDGVLDDDVDDGLAETPMVEPTVPIDVGATDEASEQPTAEATAGVDTTAEVDITEEATAETDVTEEAATTPEATAQTGDQSTPQADAEGQTIVALASELLGRSIEDADGAEVAIVDEILVDDSGMIQYVIVDAVAVDATGEGATAEATGEVDDTDDLTDDTVLSAGNHFALTWDSIEVQSGAMQETEPDVEVSDELFRLIYSGETSLAEQMAFDATILEEEGAILDDQDDDDDSTAVPSEFVNLLQVSEYGNMRLANNDDDDLGQIEDALIDLQEGVVRYIVVDFGGFLGIGEKSVAVPFEAFQIDVTVDDDAEEESITLNADQQRLEDAPEFDYDSWMPAVEDNWDAEWSEFWQDLETSVDS